MPPTQELVSVATAAQELGLTPPAIRRAIMEGRMRVVRIDGRTNMIAREEIERYRREHLGQRGKRKNSKQPAAEPAQGKE